MSVQPPLPLLLLLAALLLAAAWTDLRRRRIANRLSAAIALLAVAAWWATGEAFWPGIAARIGVALLVFIAFAALFALGMMGGGDVKLIAALALWLPVSPLLTMLLVMALTGGGLALAMLLWRRGRAEDGDPAGIPYGVAIAAGALWAIAGELGGPVA